MLNSRNLAVLLLSLSPLVPERLAADTVVGFDNLNDGDLVTNQFPGLTFSNAMVLTAGISLNEFEFPPRSGVNVVSDNGGPISIFFSTPILNFTGYFTYLAPLTLTAFDLGGGQVDQAFSAFNNNLALSGDPVSSPNEFLSVAFLGGISQVVISGDPLGGSFTLDDATFSPIPEPSSFLLLLTVAGMLLHWHKQSLS